MPHHCKMGKLFVFEGFNRAVLRDGQRLKIRSQVTILNPKIMVAVDFSPFLTK